MSDQIALNVYQIANILKEKYKNFHHYNRKNPLDELLFIICSVRTAEKKYLSVYRSLRRSFHKFKILAESSLEDIAKVLVKGGLANQKASLIKKILAAIVKRFGYPTLAPLKYMSDSECEHFLISLPGVGKKVARCIMMCSLSR